MKLDDNQIAPDQDIRDCCPGCGALGDWWGGWIEGTDGEELRVFHCDKCDMDWTE